MSSTDSNNRNQLAALMVPQIERGLGPSGSSVQMLLTDNLIPGDCHKGIRLVHLLSCICAIPNYSLLVNSFQNSKHLLGDCEWASPRLGGRVHETVNRVRSDMPNDQPTDNLGK